MFKRLVLAAALLFTAGCAHAQTAVVTNPPTVTNDCPTFTDTYGTVRDSGIYCSGGTLKIFKSGVPGVAFVPGYPGTADTEANVEPGGGFHLSRKSAFGSGTASNDIADVFFDRYADYTGGTSGFVNGAVRITDTVSAGTTAYEWALTGIMDNSGTSADNSENVAIYAQGLKRSTGKTWAFVGELKDYGANPTLTSVSQELDNIATGGDSNSNRVISDLFAGSLDGNPAVVAYGLRLNTNANATIGTGIKFNGTFGTGIDLSGGSFINQAFLLGDTHKLCVDSLCAKYLTHNGSLNYNVSGSNVWTVSDTGGVNAASLSTTAAISAGANITLPTNSNICLDGLTCAHELVWDSASFDFKVSGSTMVNITSTGGLNANALNAGTGTITGGAITGSGDIKTTGGNFITAIGKELCLDNACNAGTFYYNSATGQTRLYNSVNGDVMTVDGGGVAVFKGGLTATSLSVGSGAISGGSLNVGSGSITGGAISGSSITSSGSIIQSAGQYHCLDGAGCNYKFFESGGIVQAASGSTGLFSASTTFFGINTGANYAVGFSNGVSCAAGTVNLATLTVTGGIITHC